MGRFSGVLIASDYDGTLTPSKPNKQVTPEVRQALEYFISEGGYFTVSTGRSYQGFHAFDADIMNAPILLANGGMAYDYVKKEIVIFDGIGDEAIPAFRSVRDLFPDLSIELYAFDDTYAIHLHPWAERHFTSQDIPFKVIDDPAEAVNPWAKVMFGGDRARVGEVQAHLKENFPEISFLPTTGGYLEVLKPGVDKGTALLKLADILGVKHEDAYAVGDGYNDLEMLMAAAAAFVPSNGSDEVKAHATYIVSSNEERCVADVIDILGEKYK